MLLYAVINSGQSVSGDVNASQARGGLAGIGVPSIDSGDLLIRANFDTTSAGFRRVQRFAQASGDLRINTGVGSMMVPFNPVLAFPYLRLETGVAQTDVRTFQVFFK